MIETEQSVPMPNLKTALSGSLQLLEERFLASQVEIESWFRQQWQKISPPIYGSVDLRNAGFKLSPVDMNLFPAGFNNLNIDFIPLCIQAAQVFLENFFEKHVIVARKILLIPENYTRNLSYLESVCVLQEIISKAGFEVRIGSLMAETPIMIDLSFGKTIQLFPVMRKNNHLMVNDFVPDFIWLNNDLSGGVPAILQDIVQPIKPLAKLGWYRRLKSHYFSYYDKVAQVFAKLIEIDPWLINPFFRYADNVDFLTREGMENLQILAEGLLRAIQKKYDEYGIKQRPFVVIKADQGTHGMSVMTIQDSADLIKLNRRRRTHMSTLKGGLPVNRVILQEGVYTFETLGPEKAVAEPVVYMIGHHVVGGFYRVHKNRESTENLNAPGMHFEPLAFADPCNNPDQSLQPDAGVNRFYAYGVIARLSLLAAALEQAEES